jgi:hypothetical protein
MMAGAGVFSAIHRPAVAYLARGADEDPLPRFRRFAASYKKFAAGAEHDLFIIFKGFHAQSELRFGEAEFIDLPHTPIYVDDEDFDIGAYRAAAEQIPHARLCFLNTNSEILCEGWLRKLLINFEQPNVGLAGATGSYESLWALDARFPRFPNIHVRSNAFMILRDHVLQHFQRRVLDKRDAFLAESGPASVTRRLLETGLSIIVVGRNGRGYPPQWWPQSETFRQGFQSNLLIHDNVTRAFDKAPWPGKKAISELTWGLYLDQNPLLLLPGPWRDPEIRHPFAPNLRRWPQPTRNV